jgi:hypothetical protein
VTTRNVIVLEGVKLYQTLAARTHRGSLLAAVAFVVFCRMTIGALAITRGVATLSFGGAVARTACADVATATAATAEATDMTPNRTSDRRVQGPARLQCDI